MSRFKDEHPAILREIAASFEKCIGEKVTHARRRNALAIAAHHNGLISSCVDVFTLHSEVTPAIGCIGDYQSEFQFQKSGYHWHPALTERPRMGAPSLIDELRRFSEQVITKLPPLADEEQEVHELIRENGPIIGKHIAKQLDVSHDWVRQICKPSGKLGVRGVVNDHNGEGYYQQPM